MKRNILILILVLLTTFAGGNAIAATLTVNTTDDVNDGVCDVTHCSLREAIISANSIPGTADSIVFEIPGSGLHTIHLLSSLPAITDPVLIDGYTQSGSAVATGSSAAVLTVELDGTSAGSGTVGLLVTGGSSTIRGLAINRFPGSQSGYGIQLSGLGGNFITGNHIGTNAAGTAASANGGSGILVSGGNGNVIGGTTAAERNVISGNSLGGIRITGGTGAVIKGNYIGTNAAGTGALSNNYGIALYGETVLGTQVGGTEAGAGNVISGNNYYGYGAGVSFSGAKNSVIEGNLIGTNAAGTGALGNDIGIQLVNSGSVPTSNVIGGTAAASRNVISGNTKGIDVGSIGAGNLNRIMGNYIGTNAAGTAKVGNSYGISVGGYVSDLRIGGTEAGAGNVISGNSTGIYSYYNASANILGMVVEGNLIGTSPTGTAALGNGVGIQLSFGTSGVRIGGASAGARNVISGNNGDAISISTFSEGGHHIQGNYIGVDSTGTGALGNGGNGFYISMASADPTEKSWIGGTAAGEGNVIANNGYAGVMVANGSFPYPDPMGISILGNSIYGNTGLGIDLGVIGVAANDAGDADTGANGLQNYPQVTSAVVSGSTVMVTAILNSQAGKQYRMEFFANPACDASGYGEGRTYLGYQNVTTDGSGNASISAGLSATVTEGMWITATATDLDNNTSEFSACRQSVGTANEVKALPDTATTSEDTPVAVAVRANDLDTSGTGLTVISAGPASHGTMTINGNGTVTYSPALHYYGSDIFLYTVQNGNGKADTSYVTMTVTYVEHPPVAVNDEVTTVLDHVISIAVLANDSDADSDPLSVISAGPASHGTVTINPDKTVTYTPSAGYTGDDTFPYTISDTKATAPATVTVHVLVPVPRTLTVNTTDDVNDGVCDVTHCSLREAIISANSIPGTADSIVFEIPGSGLHTIHLLSSLPAITDPVLIDGYTQSGSAVATGSSAAVLTVELDGTSAGSGTVGLLVTGGSSTIRGLAINRFPGSQSGYGIQLSGLGGNFITGNHIGTNAAGTTASANGGSGILVSGGNGNVIGGTTAAERNVISGNSLGGIRITGGTGAVIKGNYIGTNAAGTGALSNNYGIALYGETVLGTQVGGTEAGAGNVISGNNYYGYGAGVSFSGAKNSVIEGNLIGTNAAGTGALGNDIGIQLVNSGSVPTSNVIGGTAAASRNVISGNTKGIDVGSIGAGNLNRIMGNYIGTNAAGTAKVGNSYGISVGGYVSDLRIGGTEAGAGNVISGNSTGIYSYYNASANILGMVVEGNLIGTSPTGTAALGNGVGIQLSFGTSGVRIGGASAGARNVISGNNGDAISISTFSEGGHHIQGNYIGVDSTGTGALGNGGNGFYISMASADPTEKSWIGGTAAGEGNVIANNGYAGVMVANGSFPYPDPMGISILGNSIYGNTGLGIDLGVIGVAANDAGDADTGANGLQNYPQVTSAVVSGSTVMVTAILNSQAGKQYRMEFFANPACDASGYGEGRTYLGYQNVTTDGSGNASISAGLSATVTEGMWITATATDLDNNTSEFSACSMITDLTPPNAPVVSSAEAMTANTTPLWSWTAGGGGNGTFRYRLDASDLTTGATVTTAASFLPASPLQDGSHTLFVQERDISGNWSASGSFTVMVDTTGVTHAIVASAGTGGMISPATALVSHGTSTTFTVIPDPGYTIDSVTGCGGTLSGNIYTTGTIIAPCIIVAGFKLENGAPSIPTLNSPLSSSETLTTSPVLSVNASTDPNGDPVTYTYEVYSDSGLSNLIASASGQGTSWTIPIGLADNSRYYWRALATDGILNSNWMPTANFIVNTANDAPTSPGISSPTDNSRVSTLTPVLSITNAVDIDINDIVTYDIDVATDSGFLSIVTSTTSLVQGNGGITSWTVPSLNEDTLYYWRARAKDTHGGMSSWVNSAFFVSVANSAPTAPILSSPLNTSEVAVFAPVLTINNSVDPEKDSLVYLFEIDTVNTFDSVDKQSSGLIAEGSGSTLWTPSSLNEDTTYYWRAKANDGIIDGPWMTTVSFFVNTVNELPTVPTLNNPANSGEVTVLAPTLIVNASTDPDHDAIAYEYEVYSNSGITSLVTSTTGAGTSWKLASNLTDNTWYWWRAQARDVHGLASGWMAANSFFVNNKGSNDPPSITITKPGASEPPTSASSYAITWTASDPDSNPVISLYYDQTGSGYSGTLIATGMHLSDPVSSYTWDISGLADGTYYVYATIDDGTTAVSAYAAGPLVIKRTVELTITATAGTGGSIAPSGIITLVSGSTQTFTITPNSSYRVQSVVVDGVDQGAITSYTFNNVTASHTISATFALTTSYTITASAGPNGSILPSGAVKVKKGAIQIFLIIPNMGYHVADVLIDGVSVGAQLLYTFKNVQADHTISATFAANTGYTITASAGPNGSISPSGAVTVLNWASQTFTITPDAGYRVADVLVDGKSVGARTSYTFYLVRADHTVSASFTPDVYTITATAGPNGSISPSGALIVNRGDNATFTITPDTGHLVRRVVVDGDNKGAIKSYTFKNVRTNHTIDAYFK